MLKSCRRLIKKLYYYIIGESYTYSYFMVADLYEAAYYMTKGAKFIGADTSGKRILKMKLKDVKRKWVDTWKRGKPIVNARHFQKARIKLKLAIKKRRSDTFKDIMPTTLHESRNYP